MGIPTAEMGDPTAEMDDPTAEMDDPMGDPSLDPTAEMVDPSRVGRPIFPRWVDPTIPIFY